MRGHKLATNQHNFITDFSSFSLGVIRLRHALQAYINWKSAFLKTQGQFCSKFQVQGVVTSNHFSCQETR